MEWSHSLPQSSVCITATSTFFMYIWAYSRRPPRQQHQKGYKFWNTVHCAIGLPLLVSGLVGIIVVGIWGRTNDSTISMTTPPPVTNNINMPSSSFFGGVTDGDNNNKNDNNNDHMEELGLIVLMILCQVSGLRVVMTPLSPA
mmetsp:Transcript_20035/g.25819  ORF Transcript_20035/g.25819 Transcript_20035/m.25819 type:complete len:143 (-) Transcript_20035:649-1077(-)